MTIAPQPKLRVSRQGVELVKSFEGLRRRAARLPNGRFVVGYGHIRSTREGTEVAPEDAEALLRYDLLPVEAAINEWALAPLTQNQFDALVSFAFNIGLSSFRRSEVLRRINEGDLLRAASALEAWRRVDLDGQPMVVDALVRRRAVEKALFLTPPQGQVPAPSAVLRPLVDTAAPMLAERPEELDTPLEGGFATAFRPEPEQFEAEPEGSQPEPFASLSDFDDEPQDDSEPGPSVTETTVALVPDLDGDGEPDLVVTETTATIVPDLDGDGQPDVVVTDTVAVVVPDMDGDGEPEVLVTETTAVFTSGDADDTADYVPDIDDAFDDVDDFADEASDPSEFAAPQESAEANDGEPEEELSAAQAAAAAVFARLSEILAQDRDHEEEEASEGDLSSLTIDPQPETADGDFLQAPPAPPETDESAGFPEMDEAAVAGFEAETSDMEFAPETEPDLQPLLDEAALPPVIEPEEQAEFNSAFIDEDELDTGRPVSAPAGEHWDERSGAQPTQGDPAALSQPLEESDRGGALIALGLVGMAFVIAALVSFARTPVPGADADGSGWTFILGAVGVLCICGALWFALGDPADKADDASES